MSTDAGVSCEAWAFNLIRNQILLIIMQANTIISEDVNRIVSMLQAHFVE